MGRAKLFEDEEIDLSRFKPQESPGPPMEQVRAVTQAANFHSREAKPLTPAKRAPRIYRTGRNVQFNLKASQEAIDAFYRVSDEQGWVLGETFELAINTLERELKRARNGMKEA